MSKKLNALSECEKGMKMEEEITDKKKQDNRKIEEMAIGLFDTCESMGIPMIALFEFDEEGEGKKIHFSELVGDEIGSSKQMLIIRHVVMLLLQGEIQKLSELMNSLLANAMTASEYHAKKNGEAQTSEESG